MSFFLFCSFSSFCSDTTEFWNISNFVSIYSLNIHSRHPISILNLDYFFFSAVYWRKIHTFVFDQIQITQAILEIFVELRESISPPNQNHNKFLFLLSFNKKNNRKNRAHDHSQFRFEWRKEENLFFTSAFFESLRKCSKITSLFPVIYFFYSFALVDSSHSAFTLRSTRFNCEQNKIVYSFFSTLSTQPKWK